MIVHRFPELAMPEIWYAVRSDDGDRVISHSAWVKLTAAERVVYALVGEYEAEEKAELALRRNTKRWSAGKSTKRIKFIHGSPRQD